MIIISDQHCGNDERVVDWYNQIMMLTDIALLTDTDEYQIYGDNSVEQILSRCKKYNISEIIIKRGDLPCVISTDNNYLEVKATKISNVVDTCAAGDSFAAGYLHARLGGSDTFSVCQVWA